MFEKLREKAFENNRNYWLFFIGQTILYAIIFIVLIYLYKYLQVSGGDFIYNEF
ncbi:teichoic acid D-Ala incorporation-associated protein DltX [Vagococcus coleopterorum]|uniref:Teichoic acid D-Ala incorporation-associated protein DltX n=1 Tax=Vagococcus coleopterorum TaxID=2714946 RepID=A0A6G8AL53_9ENTE|nr:teichoic acid D-Ala incorporation-associated protein DltX [Vagococcus coleopterorum]QIL45788.1 teichoic acid D-Ala incorporation-associated protein DltX [Vagococcus coleopterorum]